MTDELLKGLATQGANMAKTELRYRHELNGILAIYVEGEGLHRMRKIERLIEERAGKSWLNSGEAKDILFGVLCLGAKALEPEAIVIVTAVDAFQPTPAFDALPPQQRDRIFKGPPHPRDLPQYFQPHDALMALVQTPERVCIYRQKLHVRGALLIGEPEIICGPQDGFDGRLKLYGVEPPAELLETIKRKAN